MVTVEDGRLVLTPASIIPDNQAWFWTPTWQAGEDEADQEISQGAGRTARSPEEFIGELAERAALTPDDLA